MTSGEPEGRTAGTAADANAGDATSGAAASGAAKVQGEGGKPDSSRRRRLIKLSLIGTGLAGALWGAIASSLVENGASFVAGGLDQLRGQDRIRALEGQLAAAGGTVSSFLPLPWRSQAWCLEHAREWLRDQGHAAVPLGQPQHYSLTVTYYKAPIQLRCIGAAKATTTFLVLAASELNAEPMIGLSNEIARHFGPFTDFPAAAYPEDGDWRSLGPFSRAGYLVIEMPWWAARDWTRGTVPEPVANALSAKGARQFVSTSFDQNRGRIFVTQGPGATVAIRAPEIGDVTVPDAGGGWVAASNGPPPADATNVRVRVAVSLSAEIVGTDSVYSEGDRYLGLDLDARLKRIPGVQNDGALEETIRNW